MDSRVCRGGGSGVTGGVVVDWALFKTCFRYLSITFRRH